MEQSLLKIIKAERKILGKFLVRFNCFWKYLKIIECILISRFALIDERIIFGIKNSSTKLKNNKKQSEPFLLKLR